VCSTRDAIESLRARGSKVPGWTTSPRSEPKPLYTMKAIVVLELRNMRSYEVQTSFVPSAEYSLVSNKQGGHKMPISAKEFNEKGEPAEKRQKGRRQVEVMRFLNMNADEAFSQSEVQKELGLATPQQARSVLLALEAKGRVIRQAIDANIYYGTAEAPAPKATKKSK